MSKTPDAYNENDLISHVAKETHPVDTVFRELMETFNRVAKQTNMPAEDAKRFRKAFSSVASKRNNEQAVSEMYESMREFIINSLWHGRAVELRGLAAFRLFRRKPRQSHNLHSGEKIEIPPRETVRVVNLSDLRKVTADVSTDGTVHREGDHPKVESRRERDREKNERRRERDRRERRIREARDAERQVKKLEREMKKARDLAEERRVLAENFGSDS